MSCCGTGLESKTSHRYIRQKSWRERLVITIGIDQVPLQSQQEQPREEKRRVLKNVLVVYGLKKLICVSVSPFI